jgi:hypothetical protein
MGENRAVSIKNIIRAGSEKGLAFLGAPVSINKSPKYFMDKAGAQTRLGEAKKSFAKAKAENAHCNTIYLASCFTDAVLSQLKTEREVDLHFNLIEILADEAKKIRFLEELFHYQIRIE